MTKEVWHQHFGREVSTSSVDLWLIGTPFDFLTVCAEDIHTPYVHWAPARLLHVAGKRNDRVGDLLHGHLFYYDNHPRRLVGFDSTDKLWRRSASSNETLFSCGAFLLSLCSCVRALHVDDEFCQWGILELRCIYGWTARTSKYVWHRFSVRSRLRSCPRIHI